jgi:periplasmic protein TonB
MQPDGNASWSTRKGIAVSVAIHALVLLGVVGVLHRRVKLVAYGFPGTRQGMQLLTYYSPGSTVSVQNDVRAKDVEKQKPRAIVHSADAVPEPEKAAAAMAEPGTGSAGASGLGDGNIRIALPKYFPSPAPSLATLPHGAAGDVILHAVIDEHGKIVELTLLQGLGPAIDDAVIQTVNQWTYVPATKNGVPVPSVEELHFHYERRG